MNRVSLNFRSREALKRTLSNKIFCKHCIEHISTQMALSYLQADVSPRCSWESSYPADKVFQSTLIWCHKLYLGSQKVVPSAHLTLFNVRTWWLTLWTHCLVSYFPKSQIFHRGCSLSASGGVGWVSQMFRNWLFGFILSIFHCAGGKIIILMIVQKVVLMWQKTWKYDSRRLTQAALMQRRCKSFFWK